MKKIQKRGKRILVMILVFAILCTSLPCTPTIPVQAAQNQNQNTWYEVSSRINVSWAGHITGEITIKNISSQTRRDWQIAFPWQAKIVNLWNGQYEQTKDGYLLTPLECDTELASGNSVAIRFQAEGEDNELSQLAEEDFFFRSGVSITDAEERLAEDPVLPESPVHIETEKNIDSLSDSTSQTREGTNARKKTASDQPVGTANPTGESTTAETSVPRETPAAEETSAPMDVPAAEEMSVPMDAPAVTETSVPMDTPAAEPSATLAIGLNEETSPVPHPPTTVPSLAPTVILNDVSSEQPAPTAEFSQLPVIIPSPEPTSIPTAEPSLSPSVIPTATPAPEPVEDLYIYTDTTLSEDLVCGNLFLMGGSLECNGYSITVQKEYFQNGGKCNLTAADLTVIGSIRVVSGSLTADGNSVIQTGKNFLIQTPETIRLAGITEIGENLEIKETASFNARGGTLTIQGSMKADQTGYFYIDGGSLDVQENLEITEISYFYADGGILAVGGDMDCAFREYYQQINGRLSVGGNLSVTQGKFALGRNTRAEIQGDVRMEARGNLFLNETDPVPELSIHGDLTINSSTRTNLAYGKVTLYGDLIQTGRAAPDSLQAGQNCTLHLIGEDRQKIDIAYPESVTLGVLDLRESTGTEIPDEIHGTAVYGFQKAGRKNRLELYLSIEKLQQDEIIDCGQVTWHGTSLDLSGYSLETAGSLKLKEFQYIYTRSGCLVVPEDLEITEVSYFYADSGILTIGGDMDCAFREYYQQINGRLSVGGNLSVTQGKFALGRNTRAEIRGDARMEAEGNLFLNETGPVPELSILGDLIINSSTRTNLAYGKVTLYGDLVQTGQAAPDSLQAGQNCTLHLIGEDRQKIDIAYPESVTLGVLDLRESTGTEIPDEIHGTAVCGFEKAGRKSSLDLFLTGDRLFQDETINCDRVTWHGSILNLCGHSLKTAGSLEIAEISRFFADSGTLIVGEDLICSFQEYYQQIDGKLSVGGNLTVTKGKFALGRNTKAEIQGDVRMEDQGNLFLNETGPVPELSIRGDLIINSSSRTSLAYGKVTLHGNLIQTGQAAPDSLQTGQNCTLRLIGEDRQKIDIAYPESITLGVLDLSGSTIVDIPDEIHGTAVCGFEKAGRKSRLELFLANGIMGQDETIDCGSVKWHGGTGYTLDHKVTVRGDLELDGVSYFSVNQGNLAVQGNLKLDDVKYFYADGGCLTVEGNLDCAFQEYYQQIDGKLSVGGNLTVTKGKFALGRNTKAEIHGDVRMEEQGRLFLNETGPVPEMAVHGDMVIDSAARTDLDYGELILEGNFIQKEAMESDNLRICSSLSLFLCGKQTQTIDLPGIDEIEYLDLSGSKAVRLMQDFSGDRLSGVEKILCKGDTLYLDYRWVDASSNGTIDGNLKCFGTLNVDEYTLSIAGNYTQYYGTRIYQGGTLSIAGNFTADQGTADIGEGLIRVKGDTRIKRNAGITMRGRESCRFLAEGDYISACDNLDYAQWYTGGTLEVRGDLTQKDVALSFGLCLDKTKVVFSGKEIQTVQVPNDVLFGKAACIDMQSSAGVDFRGASLKADQIIGFSKIQTEGMLDLYESRVTLIRNEEFSGSITMSGTYLDCNGFEFRLSGGGTLEQWDGLVNLDHGTLYVDGDYIMRCGSILQMIRPDDLLQVRGNFSTDSSMNHDSMLRDGRMELWGNFNQGGNKASFGSSGDFVIAFMGNGQTAHIDDVGYSRFANIDPDHSSVKMKDEP
ncbi:MAG: cellulose binding domain-containing protein, partial [Lachnospiraceae bacterium]|nr:cellulose binding domain-containing protein [Lachnospiraceae bacterium]